MEYASKEKRKVKRNKCTAEERNTSGEGSTLRRIPKGVGRPKRFTPNRLRNRINDYFAWCEKHERYPNIKGCVIHLGMHRDQWYQYEKYPEMKPIIDWARDAMENWTMNDLWKTQTSNTNKQLVAKVNFGWQEEKTITHINMSKEQALAKLEMLAPLLLEALKSQMLTNQIVKIEPLMIEGEIEPEAVSNE